MKPSDTVYIVENKEIRKVEVIKVTRDFVTVRYKTYLPDKYGKTFESKGGIRLRKSRVFETEEEAKKHIIQ